ncbi:uncharacterized protein DS421_13g392940 [Arachis hypogaea]|nr:uncharacterized protein DS421_13g392940 [Arachis hypogaea]
MKVKKDDQQRFSSNIIALYPHRVMPNDFATHPSLPFTKCPCPTNHEIYIDLLLNFAKISTP